jgi:1,4-dihydroxy-6-naphthoate synthase
VIRRDLGDDTIRAVSDACRKSIAWSLAHRDQMLDTIIASGLRDEAKIERARLDRYLAMYANEDSAGMSDDVARALSVLLERGRAEGLLPAARVELAP